MQNFKKLDAPESSGTFRLILRDSNAVGETQNLWHDYFS